jgi:lantibiotic modifying enzyme
MGIVKIDTIVQKIANTLMINTQHASNYGLLDGKMGVVLFFYHYYQVNGNEIYRDFADELLDEVLTRMENNTMAANFLDGLSGIGWGIWHLMTNKFVDSDEDIFEDVDASLKEISLSDILDDIDAKSPFCSKGIYFTEKNDKESVENILCFFNQAFNKNIKMQSLSYLNSILYMILQTITHTHLLIVPDLLSTLLTGMMDAIKNKHYTFPDMLLLSGIIKQVEQTHCISLEHKKWRILMDTLNYDNITGIFNVGIYNFVFNKVQNNDSFVLNKLKTIDIEAQVNFMIRNTYKNMNLYNGLAGVGLTLLSYYQKLNAKV